MDITCTFGLVVESQHIPCTCLEGKVIILTCSKCHATSNIFLQQILNIPVEHNSIFFDHCPNSIQLRSREGCVLLVNSFHKLTQRHCVLGSRNPISIDFHPNCCIQIRFTVVFNIKVLDPQSQFLSGGKAITGLRHYLFALTI